MITPGDVDDRKPLEYKAFIDFIYGKLVGDKGYIGKNLFQRLFVDGIQLITKLKSNMKGALMSVADKLLLRKRAIIETVNDELKNIAQIEIQGIVLLITSSSTYWEDWLLTACFQRNHVYRYTEL